MKMLKVILTIAIVALPFVSIVTQAVQVRGYYRKDGTYVRPHERNVGGSRTTFSGYSGAPILPTRRYVPTRSYGGEAENSANYDEMMRNLKTCQAVNDDGSQCRRSALPGNKYCYRHVGYKPPPKVNLTNDELDIANRDRTDTLILIDKIRKALKRYARENAGEYPLSLAKVAELGCVTNDSWGSPFYYEVDGKNFGIASDGPDGRAGTADDIEYTTESSTMCQAVLSDGTICRSKPVSANKWYCARHEFLMPEVGETTTKSCTANKVGAKESGSDEDEDGVSLHDVFAVVILFTGIVSVVWAVFRKKKFS